MCDDFFETDVTYLCVPPMNSSQPVLPYPEITKNISNCETGRKNVKPLNLMNFLTRQTRWYQALRCFHSN